MADGPAKPVIFISYSHKDRAWLDYVRSRVAMQSIAPDGVARIEPAAARRQLGNDQQRQRARRLKECPPAAAMPPRARQAARMATSNAAVFRPSPQRGALR